MGSSPRGGGGQVRAEIFGETERLALQCVQPFALGEEARSAGVEWSTPVDQELLTDGDYWLGPSDWRVLVGQHVTAGSAAAWSRLRTRGGVVPPAG
jgi:hypothetical protein